jgi:hypothetical protein
MTPRLGAQDTETVVDVVKRHPFHQAGENFEVRGWCRGLQGR